MKPIKTNGVSFRPPRRRERGYAILLVLFFVTLLLLTTIAVAPNILTQGRRDKEKEMIWRGKQYSRGVKMFYRKTGKFPTSMDDLVKPHLGNVRFMRQAYKDPMNAKDGEWRLIYVGPNGQLIGSLKPRQTIQMAGLAPVGSLPGTPAGQVAAQSSGQSNGQGFGQSFGQGLGQAVGQVFGNGAAGTNPTSQPNGLNSPGQTNTNTASQPNDSGDTANQQSSPSSTDAATTDASASGISLDRCDVKNEALNADPPTIMGGNIIGVASKINRCSIAVYEKAKNYKQFEFIWDPSKDAIVLGGAAGPQIGTPAGESGPSSFGTPANPTSNPNSPGSTPIGTQPGPPETAPPPQ